jgi:hypothetical protein
LGFLKRRDSIFDMGTIARATQLVVGVLLSSMIALADVPSPETRQDAIQTEPSYTIIAIGFAVAGALLFIWLGRRNAKR